MSEAEANSGAAMPEHVERLKQNFQSSFLDFYETKDHPCVEVKAEGLLEFCTYMKDKLGFNYLRSLTGDDLPEENKLEVLYFFVRIPGAEKIQLRVKVDRDDPKVASIYYLWRSADFQEREVYDMYGVVFEGHPDLRRLLMHESFPSFPMRKDYPIGGTEDDMYEVKGYWAEEFYTPEQEEYRESRRGKK